MKEKFRRYWQWFSITYVVLYLEIVHPWLEHRYGDRTDLEVTVFSTVSVLGVGLWLKKTLLRREAIQAEVFD